MVEGKGTPFYEAENDATMMFASDNAPALPQDNRALGRRLYPIEFPCTYENDPDPDNPYELQARPKTVVQEELQADARLKAALMRAVEGLVRLLEEGDFTSEKEWEERVVQYQSFADPIADFARNCLTAADGEAVESSDLKTTFDNFANDKGHDGRSLKRIISVIDENPALPASKSRTRTFTENDSKHSVYKGIKFTEAALENWVPDSAHWDQYGGRPGDEEDGEGDEFDRVTIKDIEARGTGRYDGVKVEVASTRDEPAPWLHDQGVLADDDGTLRYESPDTIELEEGATYVLKDIIVIEDEADLKVQVIDGMTDVTELVTRDDEQDAAVEDEVTGDSPEYAAQNDRVEAVKDALNDAADDGEARVEEVKAYAMHDYGLNASDVEYVIEKMMRKGDLYEPAEGKVRVV